SKLAAEGLNRVLEQKKDSAKALHALGNLHQANKQADLAAKAYEDALNADGKHVASAVELAALELLIKKDAPKGLEAVETALSEDRKNLLGPAEIARATSLRGEAYAME